jgi:ribonuclease HI
MKTDHSFSSEEPRWLRMRFRRNKVWVAVDAHGRPLQRDGRVRIKYQLNQPHEYWVKAQNLKPLDETVEGSTSVTRTADSIPRLCESAERGPIVHVYTDGASSGNPGPSGIGVVLQYGAQRKELSEYIGEATNNVAELLAIYKGLAAVKNKRLPVRVHTDSGYAYGVLALNWKPKKNLELIAAIRMSMAAFADIRLVKVRGHHGIVENERADELATSAIRNAVK